MSSSILLPFFGLIFFNQCSFALYLPRQQQNQTLRWVDCSTHVPQPIQLALNITTTFPGPLPATLFCGEMDVPMDYAKPIAADNQITVGFAMNRPKDPAGLLIFLPTELTTYAFEQAPNSTLVVRHGDDHVSMDLPNVASHPIEVDFIRTGVFPAARDDALVTVIPPGGKRGAVADPYKVAVGAVAGDMSVIETVQGFAPLPSPSGALSHWGAGIGPTALLCVVMLVGL
ncbi:hypothetical protein C8R47DRAFT_1111808 [Mycena vitilis]|nr:hypothetical protein C8R47DRAFT_1111808 [Mycena vitilis]